ncbi:MAG: TerB family tellurite resistance protein [Rhizobiaceae bacterium]
MKKVAEDPAIVAELLMLFRMILADGEGRGTELAMLRRICREAFDVEDAAFPGLMHVVKEMGGNSDPQTVRIFRSFDHPRRVALARRMMAIAQSDQELSHREERFRVRVLDILDLEPSDLAGRAS